jgi:hypothetical protein
MVIEHGEASKENQMKSTAIKELSQEAHEIICNIRDAARDGAITWDTRNELLREVYKDVNERLEFAKGMLYVLTGNNYGTDTRAE